MLERLRPGLTRIARRRIGVYLAMIIVLVALALGTVGNDTWSSGALVHIIWETTAAFFALFVGVVTLVRYYGRRAAIYLLVGAGFLGTAALDFFHLVVIAGPILPFLPSDLPDLSAWSWTASRVFLASALLAAAFPAIRGGGGIERRMYSITAAIVLVTVGMVTVVPLPDVLHKGATIERPFEFVAGVLFFAALLGHLYRREWAGDRYAAWLVGSLVISAHTQLAVIPFSGELYDAMFDQAHLLKIVSYVVALIGIMLSTFDTFSEVENARRRLSRQATSLEESVALQQAILTGSSYATVSTDPFGVVRTWNRAAESLLGWSESETIGRKTLDELHSPDELYARAAAAEARTGRPARSAFELVIATAREQGSTESDWTWVRRDGTPIRVTLAISAMRDADGELIGFVGIARDITEREEIDRIKSEFISTISHELRTPLTSIRGSLGLLLGGAAGAMGEQALNLVRIAHRNCERLVVLINDILDFEKIAAGRLTLDRKRTNLTALVERAVIDVAGMGGERGVKVVFRDRPGRVMVDADEQRIMQVMANLLSNGIKFSPKGGTVAVSLTTSKGRARVAVTDDGSGIPAEFRSRIFQRFAQADSSDQRRQGGTGLGLSICRGLIEAHGGSIGFDSEPGVRTVFWFELDTPDEARHG